MSQDQLTLFLHLFIRDVEGTTYNDALEAQIEDVKAKSSIRCVEDLLNSGDVWEVK